MRIIYSIYECNDGTFEIWQGLLKIDSGLESRQEAEEAVYDLECENTHASGDPYAVF